MPEFVARLVFENDKTLEFHGPADITKETTEAIVNAANSYLAGGGGVDGAIHRAGGPSILAECQRIIAKIGHLSAGKAVITTAGRMPAKYVIHTVGPRYRDGKSGEPQTLASCYRESLRVADDHQVASISFPAVSTGVYGYPVEDAAEVAVKSVVAVLVTMDQVRLVRFVLFDRATCDVFIRAADKVSRVSNFAIFEKGTS